MAVPTNTTALDMLNQMKFAEQSAAAAHERYLAMQQQQQTLMTNAKQMITNLPTGTTTSGSISISGNIANGLAYPPVRNPNEIDAYAPSLMVLRAMWASRFGDEWVGRASLLDAEVFWRDAANRLNAANQMENYEHREFFRLKELALCKS
jgi:hypothetical protein